MKKKFYLWVGIFLLVCLATACGKEETRTETVDARSEERRVGKECL